MDTDSFIIQIRTEDFYEDIANGVQKWFDTSNSEDDKRSLPTGKNKKNFFFKDELGGTIMKEFVGLKAKTYAYLMDDVEKRKKLKEQKNV